MDGFAVVTDTACLLREVGCLLGIAGAHHRPAIDEDLRPDLLGHGFAIELDRAALRRRDAGLEPQVGGMFGRIAQTAPPQDRAILDDVVQPGVSDLLRRDPGGEAAIGERARKRKGAGDIVVGHHEMV